MDEAEYEKAWRKRDVRLAEATGWCWHQLKTVNIQHTVLVPPGYGSLVEPKNELWWLGKERTAMVPRYHAETPDGEWAKQQLIRFCFSQDEPDRFLSSLQYIVGRNHVLLATPAQVAEAAARALWLE